MSSDFAFSIKRLCFDEHYRPSSSTRITTNFANLARGESRQSNLRNAINMINSRFNALASWDNPNANRYRVALDIISVDIDVEGNGNRFPTIELLQTSVIDNHKKCRLPGVVGNNFSSFVRDYDFSVLLPQYKKTAAQLNVPANYGDLHGKLFKAFLKSPAYLDNFHKKPVICLSVSSSKTYYRTDNLHPALGVEYKQNEHSLTDEYFAKMGMQVRYFMPQGSVAPLAFYFMGDLLGDYSLLELISTVSTMETFQKIYRPEIYNANSAAGQRFIPSLSNKNYSLTQIEYDRDERKHLAVKQGKFTEEKFIKPYQAILEQWAANCAV